MRDKAKARLRQKKYYESHKAQLNIKSSCYEKMNKEKRRKQHYKWHKDNPVKISFGVYKRGARSRDLPFELTEGQFSAIVTNKDGCVYCGKQSTDTKILGIDRIDNDKGYTKDNAMPCCWWCNRAKGTIAASEFVEHCKSVAAYWKTKEDEGLTKFDKQACPLVQ